jgi:hypothetical protein
MTALQILVLILGVANLVGFGIIIFGNYREKTKCDFCQIHEGNPKECPHIKKLFDRTAHCNCCKACENTCCIECLEPID